jgi:glucose-1-phosphate thymidylyltransferase
MIHYPTGTLMLAGIRKIVFICSPQDIPAYKKLLGSGAELGMEFYFVPQEKPEGIAQAILLSEKFIAGEKTCLILGDNIFYGQQLGGQLKQYENISGAQIFGYYVSNPIQYGVVEISPSGKILSIEEKPKTPKSSYAIPGLYFYDEEVIQLAKNLKKSHRGEYEITELNRMYLEKDSLNVQILPRGTAWLDTGTFDGLNDASNYVRTIEARQGLKINCLEEIAYKNSWIDSETLKKQVDYLPDNEHKNYMIKILEEGI